MSEEDRAQEAELREWEINNRSRSAGKVKFKPDEEGYGPEACTSCEDDMPEQRRAWGYEICVVCSEYRERLGH